MMMRCGRYPSFVYQDFELAFTDNIGSPSTTSAISLSDAGVIDLNG